jgi:hypothetical protein
MAIPGFFFVKPFAETAARTREKKEKRKVQGEEGSGKEV